LSFSESSKRKGLSFDFEATGIDNAWVETDPHRLAQIFNNLLHNAIKFTETGFIKLKVVGSTASGENRQIHLDVEVEDSGVGIRPQDHELIFENYKQVGSVAYKQKGTGLGLSIVKQLVSLLNGTISVRSKPGEGTSFTARFNFEKASPTPQVSPKEGPRHMLAGWQILVVDDDPLIVNLFRIILQKHGASVTSAVDPFEALSKAKNNDFDVYILDFQLPHMTGTELAKTLRQQNGDQINVVLATANVFLPESSQGNVNGTITKPFSEQTLLYTLSEIAGMNTPLNMAEVKEPKRDPADHLNSYDISLITEFAMGDQNIVRDLVAQFYAETRSDLANLSGLRSKEDIASIVRIIHKLSSRLGQFGINKLADLASLLEKDLRLGQINEQQLAYFIEQSEQTNEVLRIDFDL
jgi:CheY-like chemotaxis protein/HPt (histidine-containing phosphotransfer) domain-containing protein